MHGGRPRPQLRQLLDSLRRQRLALHAQELSELHQRPFEFLELLANTPGGLPMESFLASFRLVRAENQILELISQITARERGPQLSHPHSSLEGALFHQFQSPPRRRIARANFKLRSSKASVRSFPRDT